MPTSQKLRDAAAEIAADAYKQGNQYAAHGQFPFRAKYKVWAVQRLMDGDTPEFHQSTAPEKLNVELTMLPANARKEMPATTLSSILNAPLISSLLKR